MGLDNLDEQERDDPSLILTPRRAEALETWRTGPDACWTFLTAKDPDTASPIIKTFDQRDKLTPLKPFPSHLEYLHLLVEWLEGERYGCIEKCSQMFVTTIIALWIMWRTLTKYGHKALLSKHKEEEATTILAEKIADPWLHMPPWLRRQLPLKIKPANKVACLPLKSYILGLPENAAAADARGQTYNVGLIDEAEFQEMLQPLLTAMFPRAGQVFWWSTPERGGAGVTVFRGYLRDDPVKKDTWLYELVRKYRHLRGITFRRNEEKNVTICRVEHMADPAKATKEWLEEARRPYVSMADFKREILIDRTSNAGKLFYPQFSENPRRYILKCKEIPRGIPILRGWDFGGANPACVWGTWSRKSRRFWVLRELLGVDIDTYQFRDLCKYLSGQLSLQALQQHPRAIQMLEEEIRVSYKETPDPWFQGAHKFYDFAGHEAVMTGRGLTKQGDARTAAEILALGDIYVYSQYTFQANRTEIVNGLSRMRDDGWPGLIFDPACKLLIEGMFTQIVYAKPTPQKPDPTEPAKDAVYSHLHEAAGYVLTNAVNLEDADFFKASFGPDGQPIVPEDGDMQLSSYLAEGH